MKTVWLRPTHIVRPHLARVADRLGDRWDFGPLTAPTIRRWGEVMIGLPPDVDAGFERTLEIDLDAGADIPLRAIITAGGQMRASLAMITRSPGRPKWGAPPADVLLTAGVWDPRHKTGAGLSELIFGEAASLRFAPVCAYDLPQIWRAAVVDVLRAEKGTN